MIRSVWVVAAALGLAFGAAPQASADPGTPDDPAVHAAAADPAPVAAPTSAAVSMAAAPSTASASTAAPSAPSASPAAVSHLPSPGSLPPGTTQAAPEPRTLGYLRDLLHAVHTDDVTMKDALLLLAQRPLDSPTAGMTPRGATDPVASTPEPVTPPPATPDNP